MSTYTEHEGEKTIILYSKDGGQTWLPDPSGGLTVVSPNGTAYQIVVSNAGVLSTVAL